MRDISLISIQIDRKPFILLNARYLLGKMKKARSLLRPGLMVGQLKERSEGSRAQWQTALGVELAAGS